MMSPLVSSAESCAVAAAGSAATAAPAKKRTDCFLRKFAISRLPTLCFSYVPVMLDSAANLLSLLRNCFYITGRLAAQEREVLGRKGSVARGIGRGRGGERG